MGRKCKLYTPDSFVFVSYLRLVLVLVAVIVTLGTTAPVESVTVPVMDPVMVCAIPMETRQSVNRMVSSDTFRILTSYKARPAVYSTPPWQPPSARPCDEASASEAGDHIDLDQRVTRDSPSGRDRSSHWRLVPK